MKYAYTAEEKLVVWLDSFDFLTYREKSKLLNEAPTKELLRRLEENDPALRTVVSQEKLQKLRENLKNADYLPRLLQELEEKGVFCLTCYSKEYPTSLRRMSNPPLLLYCKGNRSLLSERKFAIVGSRRTLPWARKLTEQIAKALCKRFTIVTGIAEGGDEAAVRGVLEEGRETPEGARVVCVLAHGHDFAYPSTNAPLLQEAHKFALTVSEHRPSIAPQKFLFPVRNRIIAGLSEGVLVVSGGERSGTAITANYAAEFGCDLFAVPYNPGISEGAACNQLLKLGAVLTEDEQDVLGFYGMEGGRKALDLTQEEKPVYDALKEYGELHVQELAEKSHTPVYLLSGLLSGLEIKGAVVRLGGNRYSIIGK